MFIAFIDILFFFQICFASVSSMNRMVVLRIGERVWLSFGMHSRPRAELKFSWGAKLFI